MTIQEYNKLKFRPRARIIRTIGDQLISGPEAAVIELVKNAYDADATKVVITFIPPLETGAGRITVQDNGHGMTLSDLQDKWMEPATASKVGHRKSRSGARTMMGSKGIGRFAAAKLGRRMALNSISQLNGNKLEVLIPELNWSVFSGDTYLSDVEISFFTQETDLPAGTLLEVSELNENWPEAKIKRLFYELRRILSPLDQKKSDEDIFQIYLDLSQCTIDNSGFDGATLIGASSVGEENESQTSEPFEVLPFPLLTACDYELQGAFDVNGKFTGTFINHRAGTGPEVITLTAPIQPEEEVCGAFDVRFFAFDREAETIKNNMKKAGLGNISAKHAREVLDSVVGVAIYRNGFRVRPYGDSENDWLTLDKRRVQNPSMHIGHNQITGFISIASQDQSNLIERSSREGFEETGAFRRLTRLSELLLLQVVEPKRYSFRSKAGISRVRGITFEEVRKLAELQKIRKLIVDLPPQQKEEAEKIIDAQTTLLSDKIDQLEERQRVLEAKSSLGAIISEVLHEGAQPATYVSITAGRLRGSFRDLFDGSSSSNTAAKAEFETKLPLLATAGMSLSTLFQNLKPLAGGKRGPVRVFNAVKVAMGIKEILMSHDVPIRIENPDGLEDLIGYPDDLSTALVNLITNSLYWLEDAQTKDPVVKIAIFAKPEEAIIYVEDNGPGIREEFAEDIFDVGFSLKPQGTGLGLNIAKEALSRSGATLGYHMDFKPGTRFEIRFPRVKG